MMQQLGNRQRRSSAFPSPPLPERHMTTVTLIADSDHITHTRGGGIASTRRFTQTHADAK